MLKNHLLIIDDDSFFRDLLFNLFESSYSVHSLSNPFSGIEYITGENTPSLILLDMHMPEMSGLDFLKATKEYLKEHKIPVIVVSAEINEQERKECEKMGVNKVFKKSSFNISILKDEVAYYTGLNQNLSFSTRRSA